MTTVLVKTVRYDLAYMFFYSERPGTLAQKKFEDDVPEVIKKKRLSEIIAIQNRVNKEQHAATIGQTFEVLNEGVSKRSENEVRGKTSQNKMIIFPKENYKIGDFVNVMTMDCTSATLIGKAIEFSKNN